jgi:competence protein ComEA
MLSTLKRWVQSTIGVSSKEANAFIILLPALFLAIFSQPIYRWLWVGNQPLSFQETFLLDSLVAEKTLEKVIQKDSILLQTFNPNLASVDELIAVGIPKVVSRRIDQYRVKGGKFRVKADLSKMYGLDSMLYVSLVPYIALPEKIDNSDRLPVTKTPTRAVEYDLNNADTSDFKSVKGIGPVLASRILKYRESLGGFVQASQLKEVYGLDSVLILEFNKFYVADGFVSSKLKLNSLTESDLDKHPYLSLKQAKAIVTYRMQHGAYRSIDDLRKVKLLNEQTIQKIAPYLSFE